MLLSVLAATEAAVLAAKVNLLGGSGEQAERVLAYMNGEEMPTALWGAPGAPVHLIRGGFEKGVQKRITKFVHGGYVKALMASQTSVRGPHPQRLRLDEVDEMELKLFDASLGQPMKRDGIQDNIVASSTHHNANGTMTAIKKRASEEGWPFYEWCYRENLVSNGGWLDDEAVGRKRAVVTVAMWDNEYENQEPNPEGRAIDTKAVKRAFKKRLGIYDGAAHQYIEIEAPYPGGDPLPSCHKCGHPFGLDRSTMKVRHGLLIDVARRCIICGEERGETRKGLYSTGTDWAKRKDWTIISTFRYDVWPVRMVAFLRTGRADWPVMVGKLEERIKRYRGQSFHDETGIGDVLGDYTNVPSQGIWMQGQERATMLTTYINQIEQGNIIFPRIRFAFDEHRLASIEDVYSTGKKYHLPDTVASGALAFMGIVRGEAGTIYIPGQNVLVQSAKVKQDPDDARSIGSGISPTTSRFLTS